MNIEQTPPNRPDASVRSGQSAPAATSARADDLNEHLRTVVELRKLNAQLLAQTRLFQTTLASISQGILTVDSSGRVSAFNQRVCELLGFPQSLLASHPSVQELTRMQLQRGEFGPEGSLIDAHAHDYIWAGGLGVVPNHYLRKTLAGRTLEVRTQSLPDGGMVRTFTDVTDYVQAQAEREKLIQLVHATHAIARVGGWDADIANQRVVWTEGMHRILETSAQDFVPTPENTKQFFTQPSWELIKASYADVTHQATTHDLELEMITAKGRHIWVHSMGTTSWEQGRAVKRMAMLQDITERKQAQAVLRESEERWKLALESTGEGVWDLHVPSGNQFFSKRLLQMYGFDENEIPPRAEEFDERVHPDDLAQMNQDLQAHYDQLTPSYRNEHRLRCKDGSWKWVLSRGMVISRDEQGRPLRMVGTHTDISERKKSEELVWSQAHLDALTGLPNRRMLRDRLEQEIKKSKRDAQPLACLFIDLDHFKEVNDTLGHDCGDRLLVEAARRMRSCVRASDTVARMGGDEFTVILTELTDASSAESILQKLLKAMQAVFLLGAERVFISASIGVTIYPDDATAIEDLFKHADQALYAAKSAGRNQFCFFTSALQQAAQNRARLASDLHTALAEQQFSLVYQPIVELASGAVHQAEALIRWQHPTRGMIHPDDFIPIAEASGLIVTIGEWVLEQAAGRVKHWRGVFNPAFQVSVNYSPMQFHRGVKESWAQQLQTMGLPAASIVVEITESLLLDASPGVVQQLLELGDAQIGMSLDDFGTGYSSLAHLQQFHVDFLKIDGSFVHHLLAASKELALCHAIIAMAHALEIKVIAEGVETRQQLDLLSAAGCDYAQGYFFARPLSAPDFESWMNTRASKPIGPVAL